MRYRLLKSRFMFFFSAAVMSVVLLAACQRYEVPLTSPPTPHDPGTPRLIGTPELPKTPYG